MSAISPTAGFSSVDVVDALTYYYENAFNAELPPQSSPAARRVKWETCSMWKLMIEMFRMEALNERLQEIEFTSINPLRDCFMKSKEFRRLMAMIRWCHWVNSEETEPAVFSDITNSASAYPSTGDSIPIDQILIDPKSIHSSDIRREKQLCRNIWIYLTQGRVADAIDLCSNSGHNWRAGVLHASCGHEFFGDSALDDLQDIQPDWVECEIIAELLANFPCQDNTVRMNVKKIASQQGSGIDEYDTAINAFICGNEDGMRRVISNSSSLALWAGLHAIKENFVLKISESSDIDYSTLQNAIEGLLVSLSDTMDLDSVNQLKSLQLTFARQDIAQCISTCHDWINDGLIRLENVSVDIDLSSPSVDGTTTVLLRQFACSFCNLIEMLVAKKKLDYSNHEIDFGKINTIVLGNIECLIAQFKGAGELMDGNDVIVDNLNLLRNEMNQKHVGTRTWAWYLRQYMANGLDKVRPENILMFSPMSSLLETEPSGAIEVLRLVVADVITKRSEFVLSHALGASIEAGHDVGFAVCLVNGMWLVAQSGAKSTGSGIYSEIVQKEDPEEAATELVSELSNIIGEGLALLVLADFQLARSVADVIMTQIPAGITSRLITIHAAMDAIQDEDSNVPDMCGVVVSVIRILDRVTGLMERNSLLEQQRSNMKRLSGKSGATGPSTVAVSTDTRRQIIDTQRLIDTTSEMVLKMSDDIISGVSEVVKRDACPIDLNKSAVGIETGTWCKIGTALVDVLLESSVQAIALVDDRRRQESLLHAVKSSPWLLSVLTEKRVGEILEEIA